MTKTKSTKRALISSVIALIVCVSLLIGTTFAWFTDSVVSGRNVIQSGNLDIELYYSVLNEDGEWTAYDKVTANTDIFGYDLWEPGYTEVAKFKVVNEGSLALKYQLTADVIAETTGLTKDGRVIKLSDHIIYGVTEDLGVLADRETAAAAATTKFGSFEIKASSLAKGAEQEIGMVITMPTTVGNEANHDGKHVPSIEFGINLVATQEMAEYDSFGKDYDALATYIQPWDGVTVTEVKPVDGVYYISNGAELAYINDVLATLQVETGMKVVLTSDINLGNQPWTPIGETTAKGTVEGRNFEGTFDGMGHTIYNVNVDVTNGNPAGLFGVASRTDTVIKNLKVANITVSGNEWVGGIVGMAESCSIENCSVTDGNIKGTSKVGGLVGDLVSSKLSASTVTNTVIVGDEKVGGLAGRMRADGVTPSAENNSIKDSVVSSTADDSANALVSSVIAGSVADSNVAENVTVLTNAPVTTIASASELTAWAANPTGGNIFLTSNIDLTDTDYAPMVANGVNFVLDGMGYTISGLTNTGHRSGLVAKNNNGDMTIKNLTLADVTLKGDNADGEGSAAAFIGYYEDHTGSTVVLENCHVDGMTASDAKYMGGLVGYTSNSGGSMIIKNCSVKNATLTSTYAEAGEAKGHVGGLVGRVHVTDITGCVTENVVINTKRLDRAGEIAGTVTDANTYTESDNTSDVTIVTPVASNDEFSTALSGATGAVTLELAEGEYKMPSLSGSNEITITGTKDTVIDITLGAYMDSSTVSFEGVTIKGSTGKANGNGSDYAALYTPNVTYTKCTFDGPFRVGRDGATFIKCTFNNLGDDYVWNMQNDTVFDGCTFNADGGKALLLYADGSTGTDGMANVVVKNCVFNATTSGNAYHITNQPVAAIDIQNYGCGFNLTLEGNTYNTDYFSGEWRIKDYVTTNAAYTITVNGTKYTTTALDGKVINVVNREVVE